MDSLKKSIVSLKHYWWGICIIQLIKYVISRDPFRIKCKIHNKGSLRIKKSIIGKNNIIWIKRGVCLNKIKIEIKGSNNVIFIDENTIIGKNSKILIYGNNTELKIGKNCTFSHDDEILVQEDFSRILIGDDCMFSHHINIRTSDAHPIFYFKDDHRANPANNIVIGNHVWITANCIVQKGAIIGNGCIVGTNSIVSNKIFDRSNTAVLSNINNCIIAGQPARVVKSGVYWARDFNNHETC